MIKNVNLFILASIISFLTFACSENSDKVETEKELVNSSSEQSNPSGGGDCIAQFHGKPGDLLTIDIVSKYVSYEGIEPETSIPPISVEDYATVNFKWKIGRTRHVVRLQKILKMKLYNMTPVERFYSKYHTKSEDEIAETQEIYDTEVKDKVNNETADVLSDAIGVSFEYVKIEGLGDAAVWEHKVNNLIVLVGEYQFTVNVDLEKDNAYDLEIAKKLAQAIIDKACG